MNRAPLYLSKPGIKAAGLVVLTTAIFLGAVAALGKWCAIPVMTAAAVWLARIAGQDRRLTAEEKHIRFHLKKYAP